MCYSCCSSQHELRSPVRRSVEVQLGTRTNVLDVSVLNAPYDLSKPFRCKSKSGDVSFQHMSCARSLRATGCSQSAAIRAWDKGQERQTAVGLQRPELESYSSSHYAVTSARSDRLEWQPAHSEAISAWEMEQGRQIAVGLQRPELEANSSSHYAATSARSDRQEWQPAHSAWV